MRAVGGGRWIGRQWRGSHTGDTQRGCPPVAPDASLPHPTTAAPRSPGCGVVLGGEVGGGLDVGDGGLNAVQLLQGWRWRGEERGGQRQTTCARWHDGRWRAHRNAVHALSLLPCALGQPASHRPSPHPTPAHLLAAVDPLVVVKGAGAHVKGDGHGVAHKGGGHLLACKGEGQGRGKRRAGERCRVRPGQPPAQLRPSRRCCRPHCCRTHWG